MDKSSGYRLHGGGLRKRGGFTLIEVVSALAILALMSSATLLVVKRAIAATVDSSLKIQALEVTRENMETMLSATTVEEGTDFGESSKYPNITWQTTVENFTEPVAQRMWVKVICGAEYMDSNDVTQQIELTHWITSVTKDQLMQIAKGEEAQKDLMASGASGDEPNPDDPPPVDEEPLPPHNYPWPPPPYEPTMDEIMAYIRSILGDVI